ncbi:mannosyl-oligosaccharide glucosidase-like [Acanthaster planci]|uniref:Mannosyl-oligosaccharide glucosidase n=1 Tax=Acanthaster planci TaxID=133434 RepID=A0A8B7YPJ2_ACAPL|nr:mannosyl-oligosaccharide glucosidase-like [Acanthaster planci]
MKIMADLVNGNESSPPVEAIQSNREDKGVNNDVRAGESDMRRSALTVVQPHDDEFVAGASAGAELAALVDKEDGGDRLEQGAIIDGEGVCQAPLQPIDDMAKTSLKQRGSKSKRNNSTDNGTSSKNGNGDRSDADDSVQNGTRGERSNPAAKRTVPVGLKTFAFLVVLSCLPIGYLWYKDVLAKRVTTRLDAPLVIEEDASSAAKSPERFWGTYRPGVYFGLKTRSPHSLVTGLMWFTQFGKERQLPVRHTCEQGDQLARYGWLEHDGVNFGVQELVDKNLTLKTEFVKQPGGKHGGDWTARISGKPRTKSANKTIASIVFYAGLDQDNGLLQPVVKGNQLLQIRGNTKELGSFSIRFPPASNTTAYHYVSTYSPSIHLSREVVMQSLKRFPYGGTRFVAGLAGNILALRGITDYQPNFVAHQVTLSLPFEMEVIFESGSHTQRQAPLSGKVFTEQLKKYKDAFSQTFEDKFGLEVKGYKKKEITFAKAALSNMLGGIGYFYGQSIVRSKHTPEPVPYWNAPLLTAVPSRSFFPRGFLWDEGFHNLLISKWDPALSKEIIGHWLDLMNMEGWIPREQILGSEARSKVPQEFVIQNNENANPPTLFLPLQSILRDTTLGKNGDFLEYLQHVFPRLEAWYHWFNSTQTGPRSSTYRWRGRDAVTDKELNPKTLTSGLDDYPRASHPTHSEFHIDLRCWMALASGVMVDIAHAINVPSNDYMATYQLLSDNQLLDKLHWSPKGKMYSDYGSHTSAIMLKRPQLPPPPTPKPGQRRPQPPPKLPMVRVIKDQHQPKEQYVNAFGYISLFPFLLQILEPESNKLGKILTDLKDPKLLWTKYGLRSLSKSDPIYMKYNTEHDPPYWRGAIWINMNFLAVRSLYHYASTSGPYQDMARDLYTQLRQNLVSNIIKEYERSGYIWENYNDSTGKGQGSHPFTGWSALVVLMMSEKY